MTDRLDRLERHLDEMLAGPRRLMRSLGKHTTGRDTMPNMSYCRFQNTNSDLRDCHEALADVGDVEKELSAEEFKAFLKLVRRCRDIADDYEDYLEMHK